MCLAKWNQVSLHLPTGLTNSCYHPPLHEIDATKLKDQQVCGASSCNLGFDSDFFYQNGPQANSCFPSNDDVHIEWPQVLYGFLHYGAKPGSDQDFPALWEDNLSSTIDKIQNSAAYLESWVKTLKADKKILFKLLTQSNKAIKYLKGDIKK